MLDGVVLYAYLGNLVGNAYGNEGHGDPLAFGRYTYLGMTVYRQPRSLGE